MKLLFDQNLSPRLPVRLADIFPGSSHVSLHGLDRASDQDVWQFARDNGFTLVSKDSDFNDLTALRGFPPKIVWLRRGNCTTESIENLLRFHRDSLEQLDADPTSGILEIR